MTTPRPLPAAAGLRAECGLLRPVLGWWEWWGDAHARWAALVAVPVWAGLGLTVASHMRAPGGPWDWAWLLLVLPAAEEAVFRGLLQGQLLRLGASRRLGPVTLANLATTVAFVVAHLWAQPPAWALAVALPSLVFGHLRERFASLWPALVMHALYNAGFFVVAWWMRP